MRTVLTALAVVMSGVAITSCLGDKDPKFSIENFNIRAVKNKSGDYESAPVSVKAPDIAFILHVTNTVLSTQPAISDQTVTSFKISSDSTLYSNVGDIAPNTDLTGYFQASENINGNKIHDWDYQYITLFTVTKAQKHNFKFSITLDDGRSFVAQPGMYELLPQ